MSTDSTPTSGELSPVKAALVQLRALRRQLDEAESKRHEPVAILGAGLRLPGGIDSLDDFWQFLERGGDAISETPADRWDSAALFDSNPSAAGKIYCTRGGFLQQVDQFDADFFGISPREAASLDPQHRLLLETTWEALENAGIAADRLRGSRTGVFLGMGVSDYQRMVFASGDRLDAYAATGTSLSTAAGRISYTFGCQGPAVTIDTACSASLAALHAALQSLRRGECDLAVVGGVSLMLSPELTINFCRAQMLSPRGCCNTFDAQADGYVRSEACAVIVLKRATEAVADSDPMLALVRGSAINQDGRSNGLTAPHAPAQVAVIRAAQVDAQLTPDQIQYVEAHGTGTHLGDPIEAQALGEVFAESRPAGQPLWVGSVKTNLGHAEAAAGLVGVLKTVLALRQGTIPAHVHFRELNPLIDATAWRLAIPRSGTPWPAESGSRYAGVSSFGFSGTNVHVVLGDAATVVKVPDTVPGKSTPASHLLTLSARTPAALDALIASYAEDFLPRSTDSLADICYTSAVARHHFSCRCAVVSSDVSEMIARLTAGAQGAQVPGFYRCDRTEDESALVVSASQPSAAADEQTGEATWTRFAVEYVGGADVDWPGAYERQQRGRVVLPTYPFQRQRHWWDATPSDSPSAQRSAAWPRVVDAAHRQADLAPVGLDVRSYEHKWNLLERVTVAWIESALTALDAFSTGGVPTTRAAIIQRAGIVPQYAALLQRWLDRLVSVGALSAHGDAYTLARPLQSHPPAALLTETEAALAEERPLWNYIAHCGGLLPEVLTGRVAALESLFPGGADDTAQWLYGHWQVSRYYSLLAAATVAAAVKQPSARQPLRVLEIGGGTGGTTAAILPALAGAQVEYCFTDVSDFFFPRAHERFGTYPGFQTAKLDVQSDPVAQGFPPGAFDVVVATNVLHAAQDLAVAVNNVRRLLAPAGALVLTEVTHELAWYDITTGLIEGFQQTADAARGDAPLLTPAQWRDVLSSAGFDAVEALPLDGHPAQVLGQSLLVARAADEPSGREQARSDWASTVTALAPKSSPTTTSGAATIVSPELAALLQKLTDASGDQRERICVQVCRHLTAAVLRWEPGKLPAESSRLMELGMDSLMAVEFRNRLGQTLQLPHRLPATLIFDHPTCRAIGKLLAADSNGAATSSATSAASPNGSRTNGAANAVATSAAADIDAMSDAEVEALLLKRLEASERAHG